MPVLIQAIYHLLALDSSSAKLSAWHIRSYIVGVQTALQLLGISELSDADLYQAFGKRLIDKAPIGGGEYDIFWQAAKSPGDSAAAFLEEWRAFVAQEGQRFAAIASSVPPAGPIDLDLKLPAVAARPHLYFAGAEISHLKAWSEGVEFVAQFFGGIEIRPDLVLFEAWLRQRYAPQATCQWDVLLLAKCRGDSTIAFARFFEELREFRAGTS